MSCNNCTLKNIKLFYDVTQDSFNPENVIFGGSIYDYIMPLDDAVYGVWYPAFIYPDQNNYLGLSSFVSTDFINLKSFDVTTGKLKGIVPWNLNIFGEADENNFYSEGVLFWYRYWNPNVYDKFDSTGLQIFVSNGDFVVHNGEPKVTSNLQSSADIIKNFIQTHSDNFCGADYISKLLASGPQMDMITEVLTGSAENCFVSDNEDDHYYAKDSYARIIQLLVKMSDIQYSSATTNKFISTDNQLILQLVAKYGFHVGSNEPFSLTSKFYSESGPNVAIKANPSKIITTTNNTAKTYGFIYKIGNLTFTANNTTYQVNPEGMIDDGMSFVSNKRYFYKEFLLNNFQIGHYLLTEEEDWPGTLGYIKFHGLGGVRIEGAPPVSDGTGLPFEYGGIYNINLSSGGSGYVTPPQIRLEGSSLIGGTGFEARAVLGPRSIGSVQVNNGGTGYFSPPTVYIFGGGGFGATAEAVVNEFGNITEINITNGGLGYTDTPQIKIVGCGNGANAEVRMQNDGYIASIEIINPGKNYKVIPDAYRGIPEVVFIGGGLQENGFEPTSVAQATVYNWSAERWDFGDEGAFMGENDDGTGIIRGDLWRKQDLPNLGNTKIGSPHEAYDADYCQGEMYRLPGTPYRFKAQPLNLPVAKITGKFKGGALYVNGVLYCTDISEHNSQIPCITSIPNKILVDMNDRVNRELSRIELAIKHNIGNSVEAEDIIVYYGGVFGRYKHLKKIDDKPYFVPSYNDGTNHNATKSIDGNRSKITLEYYPGPGTTILLEEIDIKYLRSGLNPACESFITGGGISKITVLDGGESYWGQIFVQIIGGGGSGATAEAIVSNGSIESINIINPGSGFTGDPTVNITDTSGMGNGARFAVNTTHTTVVDEVECSSMNELTFQPNLNMVESSLWRIDNSKTTYTPSTSTYYVPPVWAYGGLDSTELADNGVYIANPINGLNYHANPGTQLTKNHKSMLEEDDSGCAIEYEGCNTDIVTIQVPYAANISARLTEGSDNNPTESVKLKLAWNGIVVNQINSGRDPIGILKILENPSEVYFYVEVPGGEPIIDPDTGQSAMPEKKWKLEIKVTKNDYEDVVLPMAPSMSGVKGFFHPNRGFIYESQYLNKTAVILNNRPNSRPGKYIYDYHTGVLYNNNFQSGYNYMFDFTNISDSKAATLLQSKFLGVPIGTGSYFVSNEVYFRQYLPNTSLILKPAKFDFINLDSYVYSGGTALNDFTYRRINDFTIEVNSAQGIDRVIQYLNNMPSRIENDSRLVLYNGTNVNQYEILETSRIDKNIVYLNDKVSFSQGFISKPVADDDSIESVLVYRPRDVFNDPYHTTGKWGHLSYGEASIEGLSWYDYRRFNLITLKTMLSTDSGSTWSSPIVFHNNFNSNNKSLYQPLTNKWMNDQGVDNYFTVSQNNANFSGRFSNGDLILAHMAINGTHDYVYIGPYTGLLHIRLGIANTGSISSGEQFFIKLKIGPDEQEIEISWGSYMDFYIEKTQQEPIYAEVKMRKVGGECVGVQTTNVSSATPIITYATVKIDQDFYDVRRTSIISFYKHNKKGDLREITQDQSVLGPVSTICGHKISPLEKIPQLFDQSTDFSSLMDMHIFSDPEKPQYRPIRSAAGNVYFEDFLEPVDEEIFNNAGYNLNRYWINIPRDINWKFMSSKGYVFEEGTIYKVLISLNYGCTDTASKCAGIYNINVCNTSYSLNVSQMLDLLGITGADQQFFDSQVISFPGGCSSIDYCCASNYTPGSWSYERCIQQQSAAIDSCRRYFSVNSSSKKVVDCTNIFEENSPPQTNPNGNCPGDDEEEEPSDEVGGTIYPAASTFLYFKAKDNIRPFLDGINEGQFLFLPEATQSNLACSNAVIPALGSVFKYNYFCTTLSDRCDFIVDRNFTAGQQFVPGKLLDPSQLFINQVKGQGALGDPPLDLIYHNEQAHRNIIPAKFPVAAPLAAEFDRDGEINFKYTHKINITLDKVCPSPGPLFTLYIGERLENVPGIRCEYSIVQDPAPLLTAGTLRLVSPCFGSYEFLSYVAQPDSEPNALTKYVNVLQVIGEFSCTEHSYTDTYTDFDPLEHLSEGDEFIGTNRHSSSRERIICHYCGEPNCSASHSSTSPTPQECHCPPYAELLSLENGQRICTSPPGQVSCTRTYYSYSREDGCVSREQTSEYTTCGASWAGGGYYTGGYGEERLCQMNASCFCEYRDSSEEENCGTRKSDYDDACPDAKSEVTWSTTRTEYLQLDNTSTSLGERDASLRNAQCAAERPLQDRQAQCGCSSTACHDALRYGGPNYHGPTYYQGACNCARAYHACLGCCNTQPQLFDVEDRCGEKVIMRYGWYYWYNYYLCSGPVSCNSHSSPVDQMCACWDEQRSQGTCYSPEWYGTGDGYGSGSCEDRDPEPCEIACPYQQNETYTQELAVKTRVVTTNYYQKSNELTFEDIKNGTETIKLIDHVMAIRYIPADIDEDDGGELDPNPVNIQGCPCPVPVRLPNIEITYTKFKNFIQLDGGIPEGRGQQDQTRQYCKVYGSYISTDGMNYSPYICPVISVEKYSGAILVVDSVDTKVSSCYSGWAGNLVPPPEEDG